MEGRLAAACTRRHEQRLLRKPPSDAHDLQRAHRIPMALAAHGFRFTVGLALFCVFSPFFGVALAARRAYVRAAKSALPEP
jgi:hypothetical protein